MIPEKVRQVLASNALQAIEFEAGSTPTAVMAAERLGVSVGQIAKSLLFRAKNGSLYLVVCAGDRKVTNSKLKNAIGVKTRMTTVDETFEATGFAPGAVCPFGVEGLEILIDESLAQFDTVYPAAGTDASGVPMSFDDLCRITRGRRCSVSDLRS